MKKLLCAIVTVAALCGSTARAGLVGLNSSDPGRLYSVDPVTGLATTITDLTGAGPVGDAGLELLNSVLYASNVLVGTEFTFGSIDLGTGAYTLINNQGGSSSWQGLAGDPTAGVLYTVDVNTFIGSPLLSVTPAGVITTIGSTNTTIRGLAYDTNNSILYGVDESSLYRINTATGQATFVGGTGLVGFSAGLAYDPTTDTLFYNLGFVSNPFDPPGDRLFTLDVNTGQATLVGSNGPVIPFGISGLAFRESVAVVPEPSTLLMGLGAAAMLAAARRRNRPTPNRSHGLFCQERTFDGPWQG